MTSNLRFALFGVIAAIAITSTMDATGLMAYSAFPLFPLLLIFWRWQRMRPAEIGFRLGSASNYGLALLYPVIVIGAIAAVAFAMHATDLSKTVWYKVAINVTMLTLFTTIVAILTEEGFFRGWLWAALKRAEFSETQVLVWSSIAFSLWHVSAVVLPTGFNPPPAQVPVFLVNAVVLGAIWGMLRWLSGSIIVSSLSHGLWNGLDYVLFGFGTHHAALGVTATWLYGPENGFLGLAANLIFAAVLFRIVRIRTARG